MLGKPRNAVLYSCACQSITCPAKRYPVVISSGTAAGPHRCLRDVPWFVTDALQLHDLHAIDWRERRREVHLRETKTQQRDGINQSTNGPCWQRRERGCCIWNAARLDSAAKPDDTREGGGYRCNFCSQHFWFKPSCPFSCVMLSIGRGTPNNLGIPRPITRT